MFGIGGSGEDGGHGKVGPTLGSLMFGSGGGGEDGGHGCGSDAKVSSRGGYGDGEQSLPPHGKDEDGGSSAHVRFTTSGSSSVSPTF